MSSVCDVTGKVPGFGNTVSHSHRRTRRRWDPNIQRRRYWVPSESRYVRLNVSTTGIRIIDRDGIDSVVSRLRARGVKL